ncbi:MAG: dihydroneopterin aldolase [Bacteriovoracaceae bacterium]
MLIHLRDLEIITTIGHYDWEKEKPRPLYLNITVEVSDPTSDKLETTLNYEEIEKEVINFFKNQNYDLIETVGLETLNILSNFKQIKKADVEVIKKGALKHCSHVSILIGRSFRS